MILKLFIIYLIVVNIVAFIVYAFDKYQSQHDRWRISEATLLWMTVAGGGIGSLAGMYIWRHKTKHKLFTIGVPLIMFVEFVLTNMVLYLITSR